MARDFDGVDDLINCGSGASIDDIFSGGGTVVAWINPDGAGELNVGRVITKLDGATVGFRIYNYSLSVGTMKLAFDYGWTTPTVGSWETTNRDITVDAWNHIAITYNDSSTSNDPIIYVNGSSKSITETSAPDGSAVSDAAEDLIIGNRTGTDTTYDGSIGEVAMWDVVLTADEISALSKGVSPNRIRRNSLKGYWPLYGVASPEPDFSGNINNGTVTGAIQHNHCPNGPLTAKKHSGLFSAFATIAAKTLSIVYDIIGLAGKSLSFCYDINGDASTQLTQVKKSFTPPALDTEYTLVQRTDGPYHYAFWISLTNMQSGDTVKIRVYKWEPNTSVYELFEVKTIKHSDLKGLETENQPGVFLPFIPVERYRVTIEQTDGTLRAYPWELYRTS